MKKDYDLGEVVIISIKVYCIDGFKGWCVHTSKGLIYLVIDYNKQYCESFGYDMGCEESENLDYYKGASIVRIEQDASGYDNYEGDEYDLGGYTNLNIVTSKGVIDFWVYNIHDGFYEHHVKIKVLDEEIKESL